MSIDLNKSNSINKDKLLINNIKQYEMGEKIGEGTFGKVIVATHKITKEKVAIKYWTNLELAKKMNK
jgi:serine/threonine protein kinase